MNNLDWIDVVKLTIMTALPLGLRLVFSKQAFLEIFKDKKLLLRMALFWIFSIIILFLVFKFIILSQADWVNLLKMVLVIVTVLCFHFLFFKSTLKNVLKDKGLLFKVSLFWLGFAGIVFILIQWLM